MSETGYRFLFPCWDAEKREWCVFAAQPMGNVYVEGGFACVEHAVMYVESTKYKDPNASYRIQKTSPHNLKEAHDPRSQAPS